MADWEDVRYEGPTPPLDEYLAREAEDSNVFWRIGCGHHQNLLDSAVEQRDEARAEVERLRAENAEHLLRSDSLRAELARQQDENERLYDELHLGQDEAKRLRAAVQAVRDLHRTIITEGDASHWCDECDVEPPCPTIRSIDAALGGERDE